MLQNRTQLIMELRKRQNLGLGSSDILLSNSSRSGGQGEVLNGECLYREFSGSSGHAQSSVTFGFIPSPRHTVGIFTSHLPVPLEDIRLSGLIQKGHPLSWPSA